VADVGGREGSALAPATQSRAARHPAVQLWCATGRFFSTLLSGGQLTQPQSWALAGCFAAPVAGSFWRFEGMPFNVVFTAAITFTIGAAITLATRRALFATTITVALIALINGVSAAKLAAMGMVLHAYDLAFYATSWSTISYLWSAVPRTMLAFLASLALACLVGWLAWRLDATRVSRWRASLALVTALLLATATGLTKYDRRYTQFYWESMYVSSFYSSWAETAETLWRGQLIEAAPVNNTGSFPAAEPCRTAGRPPHIVLIHQESIVQPSLLPGIAYDRNVDAMFQSHDGRIHQLRVETYGGASWLTEFSILTGLSTHSFGGMRPFVQALLAGKVRGTLTETLTHCGYRNVLFYPMEKNFVSNARFYDAVGLKEIFDRKTQRAPSMMERDRFYYANALDEMEKHVAASKAPLFTYIQTMSGHWPYDAAFEPELQVAGGGPGTDAEMHEYLRRVSLAKVDYDFLKQELARRFPREPILIVQYGDHQPMATRKLLGFSPETLVEEVANGAGALGYITYFAVEALNHTPPPLPRQDIVDVPYLPSIILDQAGLGLPAPDRERMRLLEACDGHYHGCPNPARQGILAFHRRLLDSKLIDAR
jgi:phosphoglycerol transferase MdoB-like AlkP superfamily enzyme